MRPWIALLLIAAFVSLAALGCGSPDTNAPQGATSDGAKTNGAKTNIATTDNAKTEEEKFKELEKEMEALGENPQYGIP